jgi:TfoX/Sxy family transcriptional regulator of competence genes
MPYDQALAQRIKISLGDCQGFIEKKLFGGVGFLINGNMACGVQGNDLITRVENKNYQDALSHPFVKPFMANRGKPMIGWVIVTHEGLEKDVELQYWVEQGCQVAQSLPKK